ncbi:MAG: RluA family pseudouridine synthase [Deltaproteobacteria bacterium]
MRNRGYLHGEQVDGDAAGRTVLDHLCARWRREPKAEWRARIASGAVRLDGAVVAETQLLRAGQRLTWERPPWDEPEVPLATAILLRDPDLLAVAKPRGLPTLPGGGQFLDSTLLALVHRIDPEATPVHRLGRDTSGVVLFARTATARSGLNAALRERRVRKVYRALCTGHPDRDAFEVDAPIGEVPYPPTGTLHAATPDGRPSRSLVRVLERRDGPEPAALVEVEIETGRPHQIRIHLAFAGHPLVGDPLFGPGGRPIEGGLAVPGDPGYRLHAWRLELDHPRTGARLEVECAPPPVLRHSARSQWPIIGAIR